MSNTQSLYLLQCTSHFFHFVKDHRTRKEYKTHLFGFSLSPSPSPSPSPKNVFFTLSLISFTPYSFPLSITTRNRGASRDRTDDPLLAKQTLSQLSYGPFAFRDTSALNPHPNHYQLLGLDGLEPSTPRLSSVCSNQLSYRP